MGEDEIVEEVISIDESITEIRSSLDILFEFFDEHEVFRYIQAEYEDEERLLDDNMYNSVLIRQSGFFESFLTSVIQLEVEERIGRSFTNAERNFLIYLSPTGKVHLAHWLKIIDIDQRDGLMELMKTRNKVAHQPWLMIEKDDNTDVEKTARRIHSFIEDIHQGDWKIFG